MRSSVVLLEHTGIIFNQVKIHVVIYSQPWGFVGINDSCMEIVRSYFERCIKK